MKRAILAAIVAAAPACFSNIPARAQKPVPPALSVLLAPAPADAQGRVPYVDVTTTVGGWKIQAGQTLFSMPIVNDNVDTVALTIDQLTLRDSTGPLPFSVSDDPQSGRNHSRHWLAGRDTNGVVTAHYRAPISNIAAPHGPAPPIEPRSDTGAFSGKGDTFLLLPERLQKTETPWDMAVRWDLGRMAKGATGISSLGKGDIHKPAGDLDDLGSSFFMAGEIHVYPVSPPPAGFFSSWYGNTPFDAHSLMASEQKLFVYYSNFFHKQSTAPYGIFLRENPVNAGGGVSLGSSFVVTFGPKTDPDELKITLAHEMLHTFVGGLDAGDEDSSWYAEGLAVFYARTLALRAGEITPAQFLGDLNGTAGRYYTDSLIATPNDQIAANFWADTRIRVLPYDRCSLYFAVTDEQMRKVSGGRENLDDLLLAMLDRRKRGLPVNQAAWEDLISRALGEQGRASFQAMLAGKMMVPDADAFGPCFTRTSVPLRRYQLGFEPRALIEPKRIVRDLVAGSAAEQAGVRNGDEITRPIPQDDIQGQQHGVLTLELLREGKPFTVHYVPRGETVDAFQWIRKPGVPDRACSTW